MTRPALVQHQPFNMSDTTYDNPWMYKGQPVHDVPNNVYAFVYLLTDDKGKMYVGKKFMWTTKTRTVKGKRKREKVQSDWKNYYSSSKEIQELAEKGHSFKREILHLCQNKGTANYLEAREQMDRRVLENPDLYYNGQIQCRVHISHIKKVVEL